MSLPATSTLAAADAIDAIGSVRELTLDLDHVPGSRFKVEVLDRQHGDPGDGLGSDGTAGAADAEAD